MNPLVLADVQAGPGRLEVDLDLAAGADVWLWGQADDLEAVARVALGLEPPATGRLFLLGLDVATIGDEVLRGLRASCAVITHRTSVITHLGVRENVALPLRYHRREDDATLSSRIDELFAHHHKTELLQRATWQLGPAERHDVGLFRAALQRPAVLVVERSGTLFETSIIEGLRRTGSAVLSLSGGAT